MKKNLEPVFPAHPGEFGYQYLKSNRKDIYQNIYIYILYIVIWIMHLLFTPHSELFINLKSRKAIPILGILEYVRNVTHVVDWQKCLVVAFWAIKKTTNKVRSQLDKKHTQGVRHCNRSQILRKKWGSWYINFAFWNDNRMQNSTGRQLLEIN